MKARLQAALAELGLELSEAQQDQLLTYLGLIAKWNDDKGGYDFGAIDWDEFYAVVRGEGPVAKERMHARRKAWEDGAWVREAAMAYAAKQAAIANAEEGAA